MADYKIQIIEGINQEFERVNNKFHFIITPSQKTCFLADDKSFATRSVVCTEISTNVWQIVCVSGKFVFKNMGKER